MRRGEIWSIAARGAYTGKLRPAVIVQDDRFDATASITICAITSDPTDAPLFRFELSPDEINGLDQPSRLMVGAVELLACVERGEQAAGVEQDHSPKPAARTIVSRGGEAELLATATLRR